MKAPPSILQVVRMVQNSEPPSVQSVQAFLSAALSYRDFADLVRKYLADQVDEILNPRLSEEYQVSSFCGQFSTHYFPIHEMDSYEGILSYIPVCTVAIEDEDYHDPERFHPGFQLLFALAEDPWEQWEESIRVAWLEACAALVPRELLQRIPPKGYTAGDLREMLTGTLYEAAAMAAEWFNHQTANPFLDLPEDGGIDYPGWDEENIVADLTQFWREAEAQDNAIRNLAVKLEEDLEYQFKALLDFLDSRKAVQDGQQPLPLIEVFKDGQ